MPTPVIHATRTDRGRSIGQSIVEFALLFPVVLLILMMGLDFGRVFLGYINLNNTARIAANFAATNAVAMAGTGPIHDSAVARYQQLVANDAKAINCKLNPDPIPDPAANAAALAKLYPGGTALGETAHVSIDCDFGVITPVISNILGSVIKVSAAADFPIRQGVVSGAGGGGTGVTAIFNASPLSGDAPLNVTFAQFSTGSPTSYAWDFQDDGIVDSTNPNGNSFKYTIPGLYTVRLTVSNGLSTDSATHVIDVKAPPGPIADFDSTPQSGTAPLPVAFTNKSTGAAPVTYMWSFGDGTTATAANPPSKTYAAGNWTVTLVVTDALGTQSAPASRVIAVAAPIPQCIVPNFKNVQTSNAVQVTWTNAGFATAVIFNPLRPPEFKITKQSLAAGSQQPCASTVITVFDK
jgi:PKD repeat protein